MNQVLVKCVFEARTTVSSEFPLAHIPLCGRDILASKHLDFHLENEECNIAPITKLQRIK